jgi:hypothetical protein
MNLPSPPREYAVADQAALRDAMRRADEDNLKRGADVEVGRARLILTDTVTGARYALVVAGGTLTLTGI